MADSILFGSLQRLLESPSSCQAHLSLAKSYLLASGLPLHHTKSQDLVIGTVPLLNLLPGVIWLPYPTLSLPVLFTSTLCIL